jgi:hypothetical protein
MLKFQRFEFLQPKKNITKVIKKNNFCNNVALYKSAILPQQNFFVEKYWL